MKHIYNIIFFCTFFVFNLQAQDRQISGIVRDEKGEVVMGVNIILVPGEKLLGTTNKDGQFNVKVSSDVKILRFEHMMYTGISQTLSPEKNVYNIKLAEIKSREIAEVVVGYAARKANSLTGSAVVIKAEDIKDAPAANFTDLLQGRIPGVNMQLNSGTPGVRGHIAIRGVNSANLSGSGSDAFISNTSPLFVIDGIPIDEGNNFEYGFQTQGPGMSPLSMIPVEDIEDITILKDAQATALYGSRGAYGVFLVRTKRGSSSIPIVSWQSKYFANVVPILRPVIGGAGERRLRVNQILNYDSTVNSALGLINNTHMLADSLNPYFNNNTNWQSFFYANTLNSDQVVTVMGGDQNFNYKVTPAYSQNNGIIKNTGFTRYALSTNMQYSPGAEQRFVMRANMNLGMVRNSFGSGNAYQQNGVASSVNTSSLMPSPSISSGSFDALGSANTINDNKTANAKTHVEFEYEFLKGLRAVSTFSYAYDIANQDRFTPEILNSGESSIYIYNSRRTSLYNRNLLRYNLPIGGEGLHLFNAYVFNEVDVRRFRPEAMEILGTGSDQIQSALSYNARNTRGGVLNALSDYKALGYAGQVMYQFDSKYIAEFSYRVDGSSNKGSAGKWSKSPSLGIRWNLDRENFMTDLSWLNTANMRLSWGVNTVPVGTIYDAYGRFFLDNTTYNGLPTVSVDLASSPNIHLKPIATTQWNYALELGLFDNRMMLTYETYYKQVDNDLIEINVSNINAFGKKKVNEQSLVNRGHELSLSLRPTFDNSDWTATVYANGALNIDRLAKLDGIERQILIGGDPINGSPYSSDRSYILKRMGANAFTNVLYHYRGVYALDSDVPVDPNTGLRYRATNNIGENYFFKAGDPIFTDINGDYILNEQDLVYAGNSQPRFTGGFGATIRYKEWSFQPNFVLTLKRDIVNTALANQFRNYYTPTSSNAIVPIDEYDFYSSENTNSLYPNPYDFRRASIINPFRYTSTLFQEDGSYLKFQSFTIGYNVNREYSKRKFGITGLRLYLNGNNIYTFSRYSGPDPELVTPLGYDSSGGYPRARSFTFGLDIQF